MESIDESKRVILPVTQAASEIPVEVQIFFDCAADNDIQLLTHVPASTDVYLTETKSKDKNLPYSMRHPSRPILTTNIDFLCLNPIDYRHILQTGYIRKNTFSGCAELDKTSRKIIKSTPDIYYFIKIFLPRPKKTEQPLKTYGKDREQYDSFTTCHPQSNNYSSPENILEIEKNIRINIEDLLITRKDFNLIRSSLSTPEIDYGKFIPGEWTSSKLAILNEASTYFFSTPEAYRTRPSQERREEIKNWLRAKWGKEPGDSLLEQAINIIKPDKFYAEAPLKYEISEDSKERNNEYASTTLIIINETARLFYQKKLKDQHTCDWGRKIATHLHEKLNLGKKASRAASTIIRQAD